MNKKYISILLVIIVGLLLWKLQDNPSEKINYDTVLLSKGSIKKTVSAVGQITPVNSVDVGSEISGLIKKLNVDFNDDVTTDQVLARLDDRTIKTRILQAKSIISAAQASILKQNSIISQNELTSKNLQIEADRSQQLFASNLISAQQNEQAQLALLISKANIEESNAQLSINEASLQQAYSVHEEALLDLERTYIKSPINGVVIDRQVNEGQTVAANLSAPTLFTIAQDLSKMKIETDIDEADIGLIKKHQHVEFVVDSYPNKTFAGDISQVRKSSTIINNVVSYKIIIDFDNQEQLLLPGMTASVEIIIGQKTNIIKIPNAALRFTPKLTKSIVSDPSIEELFMEYKQLLSLTDTQVQEFELKIQQVVNRNAENRNDVNKRQAQRGSSGSRSNKAKIIRILPAILTSTQQQKLEALLNNNYNSSTSINSYQKATLWALNEVGSPHEITVYIGLSDTEFTEIHSNSIDMNTQFITREKIIE